MGNGPDPVEAEIIDAAERCFERLGVAKTTMLQVAAEADVSRTTLYKRFASIDDVLQAVFVREFDRFQERIVPSLARIHDPADRLVEIVVAIAENAPQNVGIARLVEGQRNRAEARALAVGRAALDERVTSLIGAPLEELDEQGRLRTALPRAELIEWLRRIVTALVIAPQPRRRSATGRRAHVAGLVVPAVCTPDDREVLAHV